MNELLKSRAKKLTELTRQFCCLEEQFVNLRCAYLENVIGLNMFFKTTENKTTADFHDLKRFPFQEMEWNPYATGKILI